MTSNAPQTTPASPGSARERILASAYELFSRHGTRAVGIDSIISHSGVAKMTLYRHFASKEELVLAFLRRREEVWTYSWLLEEVRRRAGDPRGRLLAIFEVIGEWFQRPDFEGCSFIHVMLENAGTPNELHAASTRHLATIRDNIRQLAAEAGIADPDAFAHEWHLLIKGAIVSAQEGDRQAAQRAGRVAQLLLSTAA